MLRNLKRDRHVCPVSAGRISAKKPSPLHHHSESSGVLLPASPSHPPTPPPPQAVLPPFISPCACSPFHPHCSSKRIIDSAAGCVATPRPQNPLTAPPHSTLPAGTPPTHYLWIPWVLGMSLKYMILDPSVMPLDCECCESCLIHLAQCPGPQRWSFRC